MAEPVVLLGGSQYWRAFEERVCAVCLDRNDDGKCGLPRGRTCALKNHLPEIVAIAHQVQSPRMDEYADAVRNRICANCPSQDAGGVCKLRQHGDCALDSYLSLVIEAVEAADEGDGALAP